MYAIYSGTSSVNSSNVGHVVSFEADWMPLSLSFVSFGCYWPLGSHQCGFRDLRMPLCPSLTHKSHVSAQSRFFGHRSLRRFPICKHSQCFYTLSGVYTHHTSGCHSLWSSWCSVLEAFVILGEMTMIRGRHIWYVRQPIRSHNAQPSISSLMGHPTVIFPHHSWANRRRPTSKILPRFMGQPMSARVNFSV